MWSNPDQESVVQVLVTILQFLAGQTTRMLGLVCASIVSMIQNLAPRL